MSGPLPPEVVAAFLDRCHAEWAAAGLPEHLEDPEVLARIAAIVNADGSARGAARSA